MHRDKVEKSAESPESLWQIAKWARNRGNQAPNITPELRHPTTGQKAIKAEEKAQLFRETFFPIPPDADLEDINNATYTDQIPMPPITTKEVEHGQLSHFRSRNIDGNLNTMSDADLRKHTLWPHLDTIRDGSQKMDFIAQKVKEMLRDKERHKDVLDPRRVLRKKMIILAISPITAFLIAFVLRKEFPSVRQTLVLAKDAPSRRGALYAPFCRMTDEEVLEDRDPEDPLILITTARISGEGFNLTRANYAVMTEPAFAGQAFHRAHRHGQQATTHLFTLHSSWNPTDVIVRSRQDARSKLLLDESVWKLPGLNL